MDFSELLHGIVQIDTWISLSCYMDLSKLIHQFLLVVTRIFKINALISLSCNMDLSKMLHGFVKVVMRICQNQCMNFSEL